MDDTVLSVSEFIDLINQTLEFVYPVVTVEGEVSQLKINQNKWVFFDLKDDTGLINCFATVYQLKTPLEDGMKVRVIGSPKLRLQNGRFSFNVRSLELAGEGTLKRAFELLKQKLEREGLFANERKRGLPQYPARIGVISSSQAQGYGDFLKIISQRWCGLEVVFSNVLVQGKEAPDQIVAAIDALNELAEPIEVLVIIRGGGSIEDLQAFNTEPVARAIAVSRAPTLVGVGHEGDVTLADLAADVRASTPSNAAELLVPNKHEISGKLVDYRNQLIDSIQNRLIAHRNLLKESIYRLERFVGLFAKKVDFNEQQLVQLWQRLHLNVVNRQKQIEQFRHSLHYTMATQFKTVKTQFVALVRNLVNMNPRLVLRRGYAIVRYQDKIIRSGNEVTKGDLVMVQLAYALLKTEVQDVYTEES